MQDATGYRLKEWGRTNGVGSHYRVVRHGDRMLTFANRDAATRYARTRDIDEYRVDPVHGPRPNCYVAADGDLTLT